MASWTETNTGQDPFRDPCEACRTPTTLGDLRVLHGWVLCPRCYRTAATMMAMGLALPPGVRVVDGELCYSADWLD